VQSGQQILKIVDPRSMQVEGWVSQSDSGSLRIGQPVQIGLDAFQEVQLKGRVASIGALAVARGWQSNNYVRSVPVTVSVEGSDARVIPDLSAYGQVVIETLNNQLQIPLAAVQERDGKSFVSVKKGDQFETREITVGKQNNLHIAVQSGVQAGEHVRLP
jgi:hypothetical protein